MATFTLPVSGYQVTLKESLSYKSFQAIKNFAQNRMKHVQTRGTELDEKGNIIPVSEVVFEGNLIAEQERFMALTLLEKIQKEDESLPINDSTVDSLDFRDGEFLTKKVMEAWESLKKKLTV